MASDLPQFKTDAPASGRRSARPNKRVLVVLAIAGIFFLLYLNARIDTTSTSLTSADTDSTTTTTTTPSDIATSEETSQDEFVLPEDLSDEDGEEEETADLVPDEQQEELTPSTHSVEHHKTVPDPLSEEKSEEIVINDSNHYAYLVVIASSAEQSSRRALIRDKYFGLRNNLLPCMRYNADMLYKFLIYGGPSKAGTAERRRYEAEKMEWNDLEEMPAKTPFDQATVLEWVSCLHLNDWVSILINCCIRLKQLWQNKALLMIISWCRTSTLLYSFQLSSKNWIMVSLVKALIRL